MKIGALKPALSDRAPFRLSESLRVPQKSGCYILASIYDDVIYIGRSVNLYQRMQQHLDNPRMTAQTTLGVASWFYFGLWDESELENVETQLLFNFKAAEGRWPPLNRMGP